MKVIKDTKKELEIEITGESHSLCNTLRKTLMEDEDVEAAGVLMTSVSSSGLGSISASGGDDGCEDDGNYGDYEYESGESN